MWLIKSEEETDSKYGKKSEDRTIEEMIKSSVIVLDKHAGPTSHQCTAWIRDIFQVSKAGHAGTLDPGVTGVLPIALGDSVKAGPVLMGIDKEYVGVMHLHKEIPEEVLREAVLKFIGKITQVPPRKSAVARVAREREIKYFDILEIEGKDVLFKVGCDAGTYIRKLCDQIGRSLEFGAHMAELRRTKAGNFTEDQSHSLLDVRDRYEFWKEGDEKHLREILIPIEHAILHVKRIFVKDSAVNNICNGSPVYPIGITRIQQGVIRGETVAVYSLKEELIALGIAKLASEEMLKSKKGTAIRTDRVFMERGVYPNSF
jgi:tRNA pseudouridine55 synthase